MKIRPIKLTVTEYTIFSKPDFIKFNYPYCNEDVVTDHSNIDYDTDYWGDGGWVDCRIARRKLD